MQLRLPQVAQAFTHLGFPGYFRVELRGPSSSAWGRAAAAGVLLVLWYFFWRRLQAG